MTTLRSALIEARAKFEELPAGEIRRSVDNILNDETLIDFGGWPVEVCRTDSVDRGDETNVYFYEELKHTPF